mgnify:FL=1
MTNEQIEKEAEILASKNSVGSGFYYETLKSDFLTFAKKIRDDERQKVDRWKNLTGKLKEALDAYRTIYHCPGFSLGNGDVTGCNGSSDDCPTCQSIAEYNKLVKGEESGVEI